MEIFEDYAYYYNLFYGNKDYEKEAKDVKKLLEMGEKEIKFILDMGCGTGRHDFELLKYGYKIHGVDLSQEMLSIAEQGLDGKKNLSFKQADIRQYRDEKKYDAVISLFHVISYQNTNEDIDAVFKTAYSQLEKEGVFLFDVWYGPGVLTDRPEVRVKEVETVEKRLIRTANPVLHANKNIVDVNYDILVIDKNTGVTKEIKEKHSMRYYFMPEIELLLEKNGFELKGIFDCQNLQTPDYSSWTAYFLAVRK